MTAVQRAFDEIQERLQCAGCRAKLVGVDLAGATATVRGDYADMLLARKACKDLGLTIVEERKP